MVAEDGTGQTWFNIVLGALLSFALWVVRMYAKKVDDLQEKVATSVSREELARTVKDNTDRVEKALAEITGSHRILQGSIDAIHDKLFDLAGRK